MVSEIAPRKTSTSTEPKPKPKAAPKLAAGTMFGMLQAIQTLTYQVHYLQQQVGWNTDDIGAHTEELFSALDRIKGYVCGLLVLFCGFACFAFVLVPPFYYYPPPPHSWTIPSHITVTFL